MNHARDRQITTLYQDNDRDEILIDLAVQGNREALEELIQRHQTWIYNIALRMVSLPMDADDITQDVLLIILTKLSTFKKQSNFRTWLYRIVANHVINMKKRRAEKNISSFDEYWDEIDSTPDSEFRDREAIPMDVQLLLEEIKINCMMGMLLCLNRRMRLVFILGEVFKVDHVFGSEVMRISKENFRQILSRARKKVFGFMQDKCGLVNKGNPCHCLRKAPYMLETGYIDPKNLIFSKGYLRRIHSISRKTFMKLQSLEITRGRQLFSEQPFYESKDFVQEIQAIIKKSSVQPINTY